MANFANITFRVTPNQQSKNTAQQVTTNAAKSRIFRGKIVVRKVAPPTMHCTNCNKCEAEYKTIRTTSGDPRKTHAYYFCLSCKEWDYLLMHIVK
jgi:DNA-directed RNA polymerase subunit M/transcription elongation factor TFIIS